MAIRRPSIASPDWLFQDFLYQESSSSGGSVLRYVQVKWDGEPYSQTSQTFDYSSPPRAVTEQAGGPIVAQIDYELNPSTKLVTIYGWSVNFRDEWPLRLGINYLFQCLYPSKEGFSLRVAGDEIYSQAASVIEKPGKLPYAFWVSEDFQPLGNSPDGYLVRPAAPPPLPPALPIAFGFESTIEVTIPATYITITITSTGIPLQTPLYWKATGGITPSILVSGSTKGVVIINSETQYLRIPLVTPLPAPSPLIGNIEFYSDSQESNLVGATTITITG